MKSIEDSLRSTVSDLEAKLGKAEARLERALGDVEDWKQRYIESGRWRKYLPTAIVFAAAGFALGALLA